MCIETGKGVNTAAGMLFALAPLTMALTLGDLLPSC